MKKVHVENWSTREKLALASSVLRSGDQNWMSVSRVIRTLGEPNRPPDWFSQKQCAVQYDLLLNNVGTSKRKKRNEKSHENNVDTPGETIVRKLTQERIEELKMLMSEYRAVYLKEKRELDDINMGKMDDRLNDIMARLEQAEKNEDDEQAAFIKQWQDKKQKEAERLHLNTDHSHPPTPVEVKPTSPLLTSLLQSPSPALLHRGTGPTISTLLHTAPSVPPVSPLRSATTTPTSTPTTLSKLLETPAMASLPSSENESPIKMNVAVNRSPVSAGASALTSLIATTDVQSPGGVSRIEQVHTSPKLPQLQQQQQQQQQHQIQLRTQQSPIKGHSPVKEPLQQNILIKDEPTSCQQQLEVKEDSKQEDEKLPTELQQFIFKETTTAAEQIVEAESILSNIKVEVDHLTPVILDDAMEVVSNIEAEAEPVEVVVETVTTLTPNENKIKTEIQDDVGRSVAEIDNNNLNQTCESDVLEDQLDHLGELDSHAVEMIVVGPNQSAVISVHHDGSNENLEDEANIFTPQSSDNGTPTLSSDFQEEVIKEETIEITSSDLELAKNTAAEIAIMTTDTDDDNNIMTNTTIEEPVNNVQLPNTDDTKIVIQNETNDDDDDDDNNVQNLDDVSSSEMKSIIEDAEVIVDNDSVDNQVSEEQNDIVSTNSSENDICNTIDTKNIGNDFIKVSTTTTTVNVEPGIETVIDNVIEIDSSTVIDTNVIQNINNDTNSVEGGSVGTIVELGEAETTIAKNNVSTSACPSTSNEESTGEHIKNYTFDDEDNDNVLEPDSSSCSIDESDHHTAAESTANKIRSSDNEASVSIDIKNKINNDASMDSSSQILMLSSSASSTSSSPTSTVPPIVLPPATISSIPPATIEVVASSSRPDTPSTEEDNEPVANLVKKLPRKLSDSIPNSPVSNSNEDGASQRAWKKSIMLVYNRLATHKFASLFLKPITDEQAHGYHGVIHRPMDLSTIKKNIEIGVIRTTVEFQRDMLLMFQNAIMYNNSTTLVYERASEMQKECIQHMQLMVEAMGEGVPLRRESLEVDKLNTRQRGSLKSDNLSTDLPSKRKRTQLISTSSESPVNKRRKVDET